MACSGRSEFQYTRYPCAVDTTSPSDSKGLPLSVDLRTPVKAEVTNRIREAVLAVEYELGIQPSGTYSTVRARLDAMDTDIATLYARIAEVEANAGRTVIVKDEGHTVLNRAKTLNFVGDAVTVVATNSTTARISVTGGLVMIQVQESVAVTAPGQTLFTLTYVPDDVTAVFMFINGYKQEHGVNYTVASKTVTYVGAPLLVTDIVEFWYLAEGSTVNQFQESTAALAGQVNFTLTHLPADTTAVHMYVNGIKQQSGVGNDYTVSGQIVTYAGAALLAGDVVEFWYIISIAGGGSTTNTIQVRWDGAIIVPTATALDFINHFTVTDVAGVATIDTTAHSLEDVLAVGNTTGGTDIEISGGDQIQAEDGYDLILATTSGGFIRCIATGNNALTLDGATVNVHGQRIRNLGTPFEPQDAVPLSLLDGYTTDIFDLLYSPTGFPNRTDSAISKIDAFRLFTIQPVGASYDVLFSGRIITKTGSESVTWTAVEGLHYFYFDAATYVLSHTTLSATWLSALLNGGVLVAILYWDNTNLKTIYFGEERHGAVMDAETHAHFHLAFGAQWVSGGAPGNMSVDGSGNDNTSAQFAVGNVTMRDEDIQLTHNNGSPQLLSPIARIPIYYRSGASGDWRKKTSDNYPVIYTGTAGYVGANGRLPYNEFTGATWQLTEVGNLDYVLVHYYATSDLTEPIIGIQGQNTYTNINDAHEGAETEINTLQGTADLLSPEHAALFTIIWQTANSAVFTNTPHARIISTSDGDDYIDWRGNTSRGVGGVSGVTVHAGLSELDSDDHLQYLNRSGIRPMTGNLDMGNQNIIDVSEIHATDGYDLVLSTTSDGYIIFTRNGTEIVRFDSGGSERMLLDTVGAVLELGSNAATAGTIRLPNNSSIYADTGGAGDLPLLASAANVITIGETAITQLDLKASGTGINLHAGTANPTFRVTGNAISWVDPTGSVSMQYLSSASAGNGLNMTIAAQGGAVGGDNAGGLLFLNAGAGRQDGSGGDVYINAGDSPTGYDGYIKLAVNYSVISMFGRDLVGNLLQQFDTSADVFIGFPLIAGAGPDLSISGCNSTGSSGGNLYFNAGEGLTSDGFIRCRAAGNDALTLNGNVINAHTQRIINVVDPINAQDAATKHYVDQDGYQYLLTSGVTTVDASGDVLITIVPASQDSVIFVDGIVIARGQTSGDSAGWKISGVFEDTGGVVSQIGGASIQVEEREDSDWTVDISTDSTSIMIDVVGDAVEDVDWRFVGKTIEGP